MVKEKPWLAGKTSGVGILLTLAVEDLPMNRKALALSWVSSRRTEQKHIESRSHYFPAKVQKFNESDKHEQVFRN